MTNERIRRLDTSTLTTDVLGWLRQAAELGSQPIALTWFLAHSDDGVTWGRSTPQGWETAPGTPTAHLRTVTLQQLRAFGPRGEIMLWRDGPAWHARLATDAPGSITLDEDQILWGTTAEQRADGWTLLADGDQGLRHWIPLVIPPDHFGHTMRRPARLSVRHTLAFTTDGVAYVALSRLVALSSHPYATIQQGGME